MEFTLANPEYLWFLLGIPFLIFTHFYSYKYAKRIAFKFANFEALKRVSGGIAFSRNLFLVTIRFLVLLFLILSLAGAVIWYEGKSSDFDFVIAIDASGSMLADDFDPNRFEAAKETAMVFVDSISPRARVGVISFSGTSFIRQRLTRDLPMVKQAIKDLQIEYAGGTGVGEAMVTSSNLLSAPDIGDERARAIVLLTDGQSNVGISPQEALEFAKDSRVVIHTIGVATAAGGRFKDIEAVSTIDEETLKNIAIATGGTYFRAESKEQLRAAYEEVAKTSIKKIPIKLSTPCLMASLLLLFFEWALINTKFRTIP
jgi:Ca-activated chloride channel family protein